MTKSPVGTIRRLPSGHYQARASVRGRQLSLGVFPNRRQAAEAIAHVTSDAARGVVVTPANGRQLVATFAETWWATRSGHRLSTQVRDRLVLDHDVLPYFGQMRLGDIAAADIQAWIGQLSDRLAPSTVRRVYTVLAQLLDAAVDLGALAVTPATRIRLPRISRPEMRFLTPAELEHVATVIAARWRAMVLTMAWATLRMGEAAGLRRVDVDPVAGTVRVANNVTDVRGKLIEGPPKTNAGRRTMTMPASVMGELCEHLDRYAGDRYVFTSVRGSRLQPKWWRSQVWRPAVAAAGVAPLRPHDLKHTGVALLAAAGVDPSEIARRAGHASVAFTYDRYGHLLPEVDKHAATKLDLVRAPTLP
jgi:integrase